MLYDSIPLAIFAVVLTFFAALHWQAKRGPTNEQLTVSFKYRKWILLLLISFELAGWIYWYVSVGDYCRIAPVGFALVFVSEL